MPKENKGKEIILLKEYLGQYKECVKYKRELENRLILINKEIESPIGGCGYSALPSNTGIVGLGSASFTLRKAEMEERIRRQQEQIVIAINNIMSILDYLPDGSRGRRILEYRYIDFLSWETIYKRVNLSKTPCFECINEAYKTLLSYKRVVFILQDYEKKMEDKK